MSGGRGGGILVLALLALAPAASAQSWRVRFEGSAQRVSFRGVLADSVRVGDVVTGPSGGPTSSDGFAVFCSEDGFCRFFRPGDVRRGLPASAGADLAMWGLGIPGLSLRLSTRVLGDFSGDRLWPGTSPAFRVVEGYAEYIRSGLTARVGRVVEQGRLGSAGGGLDGARAVYRFDRLGVVVGGYLGWGLARGTLLDVTSPAVNPLLDFQPSHRQVVAGALTELHLSRIDAQAEYRREVDPGTDYFVSERAALSLSARPREGVGVTGGADYNIAEGRWGGADVALALTGQRLSGTLGARHYRPFFDLWTVWGVFNPVPYNAVHGSMSFRAHKAVTLRARGEWFRYEDSETSTPLVTLEDRGWRWALGATAALNPRWTAELEVHDEKKPGASSRGVDARVSWRPRADLDLAAFGGSLERPLELRFQDAGVIWAGGSADYRVGEQLRLGLSLDRYWDSRDRPDAASFDWNQWRMSARISLTLRSSADRWVLPPARRTGEGR